MDELVEEARLPYTRLPDHSHYLPMPGGRLLLSRPELLHLGVATHEAGQPPRRRGLQPRANPSRAAHLVGVNWRGQALDRDRPEWLDLDVALGKSESAGSDEDRPGHGHLLHARGQVGRLPHCGVVHAEVGADGADHDLTRVDADPNVDQRAVLAASLLGIAADLLLHPEGGVARAHRVVLVGDGGAEQRHDAVAHDLVHRPLVAVNGLHHVFQNRVEDLSRLFGVAVGEQLHGPLEVGEEDGHLLSLPLEGSLRGEDAGGEVLRRVAHGRSEARDVGP